MKTKIEKWYRMGLWSDEMVANAVKKGLITEEDYAEITGKEYGEGGA